MLPPQEALDSEQDQDVGVDDTNPQDIADLFDELSNLSESELELDTISVISTPKPKIRSVMYIVWKFVKKQNDWILLWIKFEKGCFIQTTHCNYIQYEFIVKIVQI